MLNYSAKKKQFLPNSVLLFIAAFGFGPCSFPRAHYNGGYFVSLK